MKSNNPKSGCRETDISRTLDTTIPDPSKNQGGIAIHSYSIAGNTIDRKLENGGNGKGILPECSYTLNTMDRHAVFRAGGFGSFVEDKVAGTAKASGGDFGGQRDFNKRVIGSLCARDYKGVGSQYVDEGKLVYGIQNNRKPPE